VKALLLAAPGLLRYVDVPEPQPGPDEVLVRVEAVGICGSDVHGMDGSSGRRIPPLIMGHEAAGTIQAAGAAVSGWRAGQRVTFDSTVWCGQCAFCRAGRVNLCDRRQVLGVATDEHRRDGAFAERVAVPARILVEVPESVSLTDAALTEPLSVAVHAVSRAPVEAAEHVLVVGTGIIGLLLIQVLRARGCPSIVAVDLSPGRLDRAMALGATQVIRADEEDVLGAIAAATGGRGPEVAFEAVGVQPTIALATSAVRKGGTVVLVGNLAPSVVLPLQVIVSRELTLAGTAALAGELPEALALIENRRVDVAGLVSEIAPLRDGAAWFERLRTPGTDLLKVLLRP
jgi:L-iditol 2-dehydrogenase